MDEFTVTFQTSNRTAAVTMQSLLPADSAIRQSTNEHYSCSYEISVHLDRNGYEQIPNVMQVLCKKHPMERIYVEIHWIENMTAWIHVVMNLNGHLHSWKEEDMDFLVF